MERPSQYAHHKPMWKWQKNLYLDQGVPDNYTDESFLDEMRRNVNTKTYQYWNVVVESLMVTGQICSVCIFIVMYVYMLYDILASDTLLYSVAVTSAVGYIIDILLVFAIVKYSKNNVATSAADESVSNSVKNKTISDVYRDMMSVTMFVIASWLLSPILHTLTDTISTDTIYAMVTVMLLANLLFCNHYMPHEESIVSRAISLNVVIFAGVCLASRLPTQQHTHALISLVIQVFALWPRLRHHIKEYSRVLYIFVSVTINICSISLMSTVSAVGTCLLTLLILLILFVAPAYLIYLQPLKDTVHGPWDEAEIRKDK